MTMAAEDCETVEETEELKLPSAKWFLEKKSTVNKNLIKRKSTPQRPPFSYSQIIVQAFVYYRYRKLALYEIYDFFLHRFVYFRQEKSSWRNSVRHLLSLDPRFIKVPREKGEPGKGAFWLLDRDIVELDGSLKPGIVTPKNRKLPLKKVDNNDSNEGSQSPVSITDDSNVMKPHINPIVQKYIERIRLTRQDSETLSDESSMVTSPEIVTHQPEPVKYCSSFGLPIRYEYEFIESSSSPLPMIEYEEFEPELSTGMKIGEDVDDIMTPPLDDGSFYHLDNIDFELPMSDEFENLLDDEFLRYYSNLNDDYPL